MSSNASGDGGAAAPTEVTVGTQVRLQQPASDSVRIELFRYRQAHACPGCIEQAGDWGRLGVGCSLKYACSQREGRLMSTFLCSDHEDNTTTISTSAQTSDRCSRGRWMVVSSKKRGTVSVLLYRPSSLISSVATFRGKIPVLAGGKLVPGCAYYRQRLAYFEVEVLHSYGEKPKLAIGWAGNDHPLDDVSLGECSSSVGYCSSDGAMISGLEGMDPLESNYVHGRSVENDSLRTPSGQSIVSQQDGRAAAATFSRDWSDADIVGCGLDCRSGEVFFTLNGNVLALPFRLGPDFLRRARVSRSC